MDTDIEVEAAAGQSIAEMVAAQGEEAFRRLEAQVCLHAARQPGQVIATGGGALLDGAARQALQASGIIVCLTCDFEEIIRRLGDGALRPLYRGDRALLQRLFTERESLYQSLPHQIDTTERMPDQVAEEVIRLWQKQR